MNRILLSIIFLFKFLYATSQNIDGSYVALELNGLEIDSSGQMYFYGLEFYPKDKWYHEVKVKIKSGKITIEKFPVIFQDSVKSYSASDGGFVTYKGSLVKFGDVYIGKTKMTEYDYKGFSLIEPPLVTDDYDTIAIDKPKGEKSVKEREKELMRTHDWVRKDNGLIVFFPKGLLRKDFIIRPEKNGIWVNNVFFNRYKNE